jgi:hypothetical protein
MRPLSVVPSGDLVVRRHCVRRIHQGSQGARTYYDIHDSILSQSGIAAARTPCVDGLAMRPTQATRASALLLRRGNVRTAPGMLKGL